MFVTSSDPLDEIKNGQKTGFLCFKLSGNCLEIIFQTVTNFTLFRSVPESSDLDLLDIEESRMISSGDCGWMII